MNGCTDGNCRGIRGFHFAGVVDDRLAMDVALVSARHEFGVGVVDR